MQAPASQCCAEGCPISVLKASEYPRIQYWDEAKEEGIVSMLFVPLKLRDDIIKVNI